MTFFGEYVKEKKKKIKANPESSMLIPEFCIHFFEKCRARSGVVVQFLDLSWVHVITGQTL